MLNASAPAKTLQIAVHVRQQVADHDQPTDRHQHLQRDSRPECVLHRGQRSLSPAATLRAGVRIQTTAHGGVLHHCVVLLARSRLQRPVIHTPSQMAPRKRSLRSRRRQLAQSSNGTARSADARRGCPARSCRVRARTRSMITAVVPPGSTRSADLDVAAAAGNSARLPALKIPVRSRSRVVPAGARGLDLARQLACRIPRPCRSGATISRPMYQAPRPRPVRPGPSPPRGLPAGQPAPCRLASEARSSASVSISGGMSKEPLSRPSETRAPASCSVHSSPRVVDASPASMTSLRSAHRQEAGRAAAPECGQAPPIAARPRSDRGGRWTGSPAHPARASSAAWCSSGYSSRPIVIGRV